MRWQPPSAGAPAENNIGRMTTPGVCVQATKQQGFNTEKKKLFKDDRACSQRQVAEKKRRWGWISGRQRVSKDQTTFMTSFMSPEQKWGCSLRTVRWTKQSREQLHPTAGRFPTESLITEPLGGIITQQALEECHLMWTHFHHSRVRVGVLYVRVKEQNNAWSEFDRGVT